MQGGLEEDLIKLRKAYEEAYELWLRITASHPQIWRIVVGDNPPRKQLEEFLPGVYWSREEAHTAMPQNTTEKLYYVRTCSSTELSIRDMALLVKTCKAYDCYEPLRKKGKKCANDTCDLELCQECSTLGRTHCEIHRERGG